MRTLQAKIVALVLVAILTAVQFLFLPFFFYYGHKTALVIVLFDVAFCVLVTFSASIYPEEKGVRVEQFGVNHLHFECGQNTRTLCGPNSFIYFHRD